MPAENILVTFWSRTGKTEKLALGAALGAVQARAKIRLRWLRERVEDGALDSIPERRVNRERMGKEYIEPREDDFAWADGMVIAIPASLSLAATELRMYLHALATARSNGKLRSKAAVVIVSGSTAGDDNPSAAAALSAALSDLDMSTVPSELFDLARRRGEEHPRSGGGAATQPGRDRCGVARNSRWKN